MNSMDLNKACLNILAQLASFVEQIKEHDFDRRTETLSNSTLGQHLRHTLEFFICFEQGYEQGTINYDKRIHDKLIESDKFIALSTINRITDFVKVLKEEKNLKLEAGYNLNNEEFITIDTTANRELVYNIEHAVHHMAIMKIGIREIAPYIKLSPDFGVAASTIRFKEAVASPSN